MTPQPDPLVFEVKLTYIATPDVPLPDAEEIQLAVGQGLSDLGLEWWEWFEITATQKGSHEALRIHRPAHQ
jgi:hypothetical protein